MANLSDVVKEQVFHHLSKVEASKVTSYDMAFCDYTLAVPGRYNLADALEVDTLDLVASTPAELVNKLGKAVGSSSRYRILRLARQNLDGDSELISGAELREMYEKTPDAPHWDLYAVLLPFH